MNAKVTLNFDEEVVKKAKVLAESHGLSLSRLIEVLLRKATGGNYSDIENMPVSDWVSLVSDSPAEYIKGRSRKDLKDEFYKSRK